MRRTSLMVIAWSLLLAGAAAAAPSAPTAAQRDSIRRLAEREGWPDTRVAERARGWVVAFSTGEPAMKQFLADEMAPKDTTKTVKQRVERYRDLHQRYGRLTLAAVEKSTPTELTAKLMSEDGSPHTFVFTAQAEAPYKLVSVAIREAMHGHGFGFGHP